MHYYHFGRAMYRTRSNFFIDKTALSNFIKAG